MPAACFKHAEGGGEEDGSPSNAHGFDFVEDEKVKGNTQWISNFQKVLVCTLLLALFRDYLFIHYFVS